ncbi:hypothetical protein DEU56DRAFT_949539 [Suillus clintonianus]|uniref:uncharacterized protein n=1 Tax=Suillus clintonianus TaxID=1904413 RepID=UPI001B8802E1|nr:uncharacterized protein DEU56DRAFT_949539 [Suillus clintonianus]KAG2135137.1 hypothetical protein DEU56DRAFT_949539 [Suillus clintonianus]
MSQFKSEPNPQVDCFCFDVSPLGRHRSFGQLEQESAGSVALELQTIRTELYSQTLFRRPPEPPCELAHLTEPVHDHGRMKYGTLQWYRTSYNARRTPVHEEEIHVRDLAHGSLLRAGATLVYTFRGAMVISVHIEVEVKNTGVAKFREGLENFERRESGLKKKLGRRTDLNTVQGGHNSTCPQSTVYGLLSTLTKAKVSIITGFVASHVNVTTTDGHSGTGWAFGIGEGLDLTKGTLGYSSWDVLKSKKNSIVIAADVDALVITFFVNGSLKAAFFGAGVGEDKSGGYGHSTWE